MPRFEEGYLAFEFGNRWRVFKLDSHPDYRNRMERVDKTKAVDFVGILGERELFLIEVKDFRQHRIETKDRLLSGELAIELAQKARDSVACVVGAYHTSSTFEHWQPYIKLLCDRGRPIKVTLWLEYDLPSHPRQRRKALASTRANILKKKLTWLTHQVLVCGSDKSDLPDVTVSNLPRS